MKRENISDALNNIDFDINDALKMHKDIPDYQIEIANML